MRSTRLLVSVVVCLLLLSTRTILAQAALDCATLVSQSLTDFGNNCRNLQSNSLCYGHKLVTAQTNSSNSGSFQNSTDQLPLNVVESITASPANPTTAEWGLALANMIPANSTTAVNMLLMGDAKLALAPTVPTSLKINTSFGSTECSEAPSIAAINTTGDTPTALKINGIDTQANSLVIFQQESANAIKAIVYSGSFAVSGGATAQAGQTLAGVMDNKGTVLFWSAPRPTNENESETAAVVVAAFNGLGVIQPTPMPPPPTATPIPPTEAPISNETCGEGVTHVVQPGENLFRIALRYGTSIGTIQKANGISDMNQIVVGQTLVIPCGVDSGTSSVAPGSTDSTNQPTAAPSDSATPVPAVATTQTIDCSAFNGSLPSNAPPAFQQLFNQFCSQP